MDKDKRIEELEGQLKQRDERITELTQERDQERELNSELREQFEDAHAMVENWIEAFDMVMDDDGKWTWNKLAYVNKLEDDLTELRKKWNRFVGKYNAVVAPTLRNLGRPLAASPAQKADVLKRRKAGQALRHIADETGLSFQTVRTVIDKADGVDRATLARLEKIAPDKVAEALRRSNRKLRNTLPGRIDKLTKRGAELRKKLKGQA